MEQSTARSVGEPAFRLLFSSARQQRGHPQVPAAGHHHAPCDQDQRRVLPPTVVGHVPAPDGTTGWAWTPLQRPNLVKNPCLIGVCLQLWWHIPSRCSLPGGWQHSGGPA